MKRTFVVVLLVVGCLTLTSAQQPAPRPPGRGRIADLLTKGGSYYSGTERPLSASVLGSFVSWQPGEIGLLVLWRGTERWYYASPRSGSGGGNAQGYSHSAHFGSVRIDLTLNQTRRIASVNNVEVSLSEGQNVLLVDGADKKDNLSVRAIRVDLSSPAPASGSTPSLATSELAAIVRRSPEIVSFLQCDTPASAVPGRVTGYVCEDLEAK